MTAEPETADDTDFTDWEAHVTRVLISKMKSGGTHTKASTG